MTTSPRRVLVIEDDLAQQLMYQRALRDMEFEYVGVTNAADAMRTLSRQAFAVTILDLRLGYEFSLDLFENIRERFPAVSVVIATGHGSFELAQRSINRDVVDFLSKPIPLVDLEHAIDRAWSRHVLVQTPVSRLRPAVAREVVETDDPPASTWLATRKSLNIDSLERELIVEALRRSGDNRKAAAAMLGISERKLYYRLTQYRVV